MNGKLAWSIADYLAELEKDLAGLDEETRKIIEHGRRIRVCLKQPEFAPVSVPDQVAILLAFDRTTLRPGADRTDDGGPTGRARGGAGDSAGGDASLRRQIASAGDLCSLVRKMKVLAASNIGQYEQSVRALAD